MLCALACLADQDDGEIYGEIVEARLNLIHRDIDRAGDVAGGEFGAGAHVHEQSGSGWASLQFGYGYGGAQNFLLHKGRAGVGEKGFKGRLGKADSSCLAALARRNDKSQADSSTCRRVRAVGARNDKRYGDWPGALVQGLGLEGDVGFAGGFLCGVFFHPGFPALARGGVASGEGEGGDVGVGDGDFFVGSLWEEANYGIFQRGRGAAVEEVAFDFAAVFASDGDVATVVEGLFEGDADFFVVAS